MRDSPLLLGVEQGVGLGCDLLGLLLAEGDVPLGGMGVEPSPAIGALGEGVFLKALDLGLFFCELFVVGSF